MVEVSVVVPAYNVERYLPRCLDSLLAQTEGDLEIIVVDDGSSDRTGEVADRYAVQDHRVRVVHRANGGLSAARNSGLDVATGHFVSLIDGDDWVDPEMLELMAARLRQTSAEVVIAGMHVDHHDVCELLVSSHERRPPDMLVEYRRPITEGVVDDVFINLLGYAWNKMYRRVFIASEGIRFREGVSLVEDVLFNAEVITRADRIVFLNRAFVHYIQRPRITLGTQTYADLLDLRLCAVHAIEKSLSALGVNAETRMSVAARLSQSALVMAVRSAARQPGTFAQRVDFLRHLLSVSGAGTLHSLAKTRPARRRRDALILTLLRREHLRPALLLMHTAVTRGSIRRNSFTK